MHWKNVDNLITKHNELALSISTKTAALLKNETDANDPDNDNDLDAFLKPSSPVKKKKTRVIEEAHDIDAENDDSFIEILFKGEMVEGDDDVQIEKVLKCQKDSDNDDDAVEAKK